VDDPAVDVIARLTPEILRALHVLEFAGRHLAPATLDRLIATVTERTSDLDGALEASRALAWPDRLVPARECLETAASFARDSIAALLVANDDPQPILAAYRSLRGYARAAEAIYPMAPHLKPVSKFFLEMARRDDETLIEQLANPRPDTGVTHVGGPAGARGGFSLYVPENYDAARPCPLVVALHGGSGNGGAFLWSWLREARTRGFVLMAPTARGSTWSLLEPQVDGPNIDRMIEDVAARWNVDPERKLLTGMSDGGTFTYVLGLRGDCQFTHLAPVAAAFHPLLLSMADGERLHDLPLYIVHGHEDWMFPPELARNAERALRKAGANVTYREVADLSHTYPRDENGGMLDWFLK
jgi:phospholipase/carboxylesterase